MSSELIYTDGACSGNGTRNATGGFGLFIAKSDIFSGPVKINKKGETMEFDINGKKETFYITNIRMEGLAIVSTLALYTDALINNPNDDTILKRLNRISFNANNLDVVGHHTSKHFVIEIVTDSLFWINVIESWMPTWIRKGIMMEKKNPDILLLLRYYTDLMKQNNIQIIFTHVKSHQKGKRTHHADGNDVADVLATSSVSNISNDFTIV